MICYNIVLIVGSWEQPWRGKGGAFQLKIKEEGYDYAKWTNGLLTCSLAQGGRENEKKSVLRSQNRGGGGGYRNIFFFLAGGG